MKKYPICKQLSENASIHCAALAIVDDSTKIVNGKLEIPKPSEKYGNGTITFVRYKQKTYGITCWHVVKHLRELNRNSNSKAHYSFFTMVNGFYSIGDTFIRPEPEYGLPELDVMLREINPEHIKKIGKTPIQISDQKLPLKLKFGYAVGFPENRKYKINETSEDYIISMPQYEILAEIEYKPNNRFLLRSELPQVPENTDFSGMSGGPVFWSSKTDYGIYGIAYEAGTAGPEIGDNIICVFAELATHKEIISWIEKIK